MASAWKQAKAIPPPAKSAGSAEDKPAKAPTPPREPPPDIEAYYESGKGCFWTKNGKGQWQKFTTDEMTCYLKNEGFLAKAIDGRPCSEIENHLHRVRFHRAIDWAGELAGWPIGKFTMAGQDILVTRAREPITPRKGDFPLIRQFFETLLGRMQFSYFKGWLKGRLEALRDGYPFRPGQLLAFCGGVNCGKSFAQRLITDMLGGRVGDPTIYLLGETTFTYDFLRAEHSPIEDKALKDFSHSKRRAFAANLKTMVVNEDQKVHPKGKEGKLLPVCLSTTLSVNDSPESMAILPPLDSDVRDKVIYFMCRDGDLPMRKDRTMQRGEQLELFRKEMPAFLWYLDRWEIPGSMVDPGNRFSVACYHNEAVVLGIRGLTPQERLLHLLQVLDLPWDFDGAIRGTAAEIEAKIRTRDFRGLLDRVITFNNNMGVLLALIAKAEGEERVRITGSKGGHHVYSIFRNEL